MARRTYVRDRRGRFATTGATARGGRLTKESGARYATQTAKATGKATKSTISQKPKAKPAAKLAPKGGALAKRMPVAVPKPQAAAKPKAAPKSDTADRKVMVPGKYFADQKPRMTESLNEMKAMVNKGAGTSKAERQDFFLAAGITKPNAKGIAVGREPQTAAEWRQARRAMFGVAESDRNRAARPGVINGIDIQKNFRPWAVFGLDPKTATKADVESAYRKLSKQVHPDLGGRRKDFEKVKTMRDSMVAMMEMSAPPKAKPKRKR